MDFLEIRRKAKERAAARAAAAAAPPAPSAAAGPPPVLSPTSLELEPLPIPALPARPGGPEPLAELPPLRDFEPPPEPPPDPETQRRAREAAAEVARLEAGFEAKLKDLPTAPDSRFRTWRPSLDLVPGPAPIAPEHDDERSRAVPLAPSRTRRERPPTDPMEEFFYRQDEPGPELATLGPSHEVASQAAEAAPLDEYLTFMLDAEEFGVEIGRVREVMRAPPITEVPRAPADVLGVITVRGEVVAVIDLRGRLGLPTSGSVRSGRVIIVDDGRGAFGLQVDAVASVVRLPRGSLEPCPQGVGGAAADCLVGIGRSRDRLFTVLAVPTLLRPARRIEVRN